MTKTELSFEDFITIVDSQYTDFVSDINQFLLNSGCKLKIQPAKNGYVVSYVHTASKKTVANFVFRKKGLILRLYADHVKNYMNLLENLPKDMKQSIAKSSDCKRLLNPSSCNDKCTMGYSFILEDKMQQKCRYNCFMLLLSKEANPIIRQMLEREIALRTAV